MKTNYSVAFACIAAATAGLSEATTFAVADTAAAVGKCDTAELIAKLLPLLGDDNFPKCQKDSEFTFFPFTGLPNNAQITKLCKTKACQSLLEQIVEAELPSCELEYQGIAFNVKDTVELLATKCLPPSSQ